MPQHEKTYILTCEPSLIKSPLHEDTLHLRFSKIRPEMILISLCDDTQTDLNIRYAHTSDGTFSNDVASNHVKAENNKPDV